MIVSEACAAEQTMDLVLDFSDRFLFTPYVYPASWPEDDALRQFISLLLVVHVGGAVMYFTLATFSYFVIFDHSLMNHPQFLKNQIRREIGVTVTSIPGMAFPTAALFLLEVRGYSRLYDLDISQVGLARLSLDMMFSTVCFLIFTDSLIYWIHRGLHHRSVYKHLHKVHHTWKVPTPYASHAFHAVDGFLQSLPYHLYPFFFPLNKYVYLALFVFVNIWTVSIHDGDYRVPAILKPFVNGSAHHTDHHLFYNYNYGQFFTFWDKFAGSFKEPSAFQGKSLLDDVKKGKME